MKISTIAGAVQGAMRGLKPKEAPALAGRVTRRDILHVFCLIVAGAAVPQIVVSKDRSFALTGARELGDMKREIVEAVDGRKGYEAIYSMPVGKELWTTRVPLETSIAASLVDADAEAERVFTKYWNSRRG